MEALARRATSAIVIFDRLADFARPVRRMIRIRCCSEIARALAALSVGAMLVAGGGCKRAAPMAAPGGEEGDPAGEEHSMRVPDFDGSSRADSPRAADARWIRATGGDPIDLAALADAEGAAGLLDGIEDGGPIARTAVRALPYADDAPIALGRLGELARRGGARVVDHVLAAVVDIAARYPPQRDPLDPSGALRCANALTDISEDSQSSARSRSLARSALQMLVEHGLVRADRIAARPRR